MFTIAIIITIHDITKVTLFFNGKKCFKYRVQ